MDGQFYVGLAYASSIRVSDLLAASQTFARAESVLRVVDLLALCKRKGTL